MKNKEQESFISILNLKPAQQICIVTHDLKKTALHYSKMLGLKPFIFPKIVYSNITYLDKPSNGYWEMAFSRMGYIEIELAKPIRSPNIYEDFLNKHGEGLHHLGFEVEDLDESIALAKKAGISVLMSGRTINGGFAHLDTTKYGGVIFELIQRPSPRA